MDSSCQLRPDRESTAVLVGKTRTLEKATSPAPLIDHTRQVHELFVVHSCPAEI
jgi:hypothetical protein